MSKEGEGQLVRHLDNIGRSEKTVVGGMVEENWNRGERRGGEAEREAPNPESNSQDSDSKKSEAENESGIPGDGEWFEERNERESTSKKK